MLLRTISAAHVHTSAYSHDRREQLKRTPIDNMHMQRFANMVGVTTCVRAYTHVQTRVDWWLDCAQHLTSMIQTIIEFAKLIPGFLSLPQDDQIMLLKGGVCISDTVEHKYGVYRCIRTRAHPRIAIVLARVRFNHHGRGARAVSAVRCGR